MTTTNKDSKDFYKMLDKLKQDADKEEDYNGGGAYRAFLKLFYKAKIEDDKKSNFYPNGEFCTLPNAR